MKWYFYIIVLMTLSCKGSVTVTEDAIGADTFYAKGSFKPYSGRCIVLYNNIGKIKEQFTFRNGKLDGEALTWYENGQIRRKGYYDKGYISGKWTFWDENGHKTIEANYKMDLLQGSYTALFANGRVKEKGEFFENMKLGKWVYYNENGHLVQSILR